MKVTVTKPAKTKTWNPRDRFFWAAFWSALSYHILMGFSRLPQLGSVEFFIISIIGYFIWWAFVYFVLERWVFGPKND